MKKKPTPKDSKDQEDTHNSVVAELLNLDPDTLIKKRQSNRIGDQKMARLIERFQSFLENLYDAVENEGNIVFTLTAGNAAHLGLQQQGITGLEKMLVSFCDQSGYFHSTWRSVDDPTSLSIRIATQNGNNDPVSTKDTTWVEGVLLKINPVKIETKHGPHSFRDYIEALPDIED